MNRTYHPRNQPIHGYKVQNHPLYVTWADMMTRCYNEKFPQYDDYGGRGIKVCDEWHHFRNFAQDMWPRPFAEATLDRIDNDKNYNKENCSWATRSEQCVNRRIFANNTSGYTGVVNVDCRWNARFDYQGDRYQIGRFDTAQEAHDAREKFLALFWVDTAAAIRSISEPTVWSTSSTGIRGVTRTKDGGYIVRVTENGVRKYLGYYKDLELAIDERNKHIERKA